MKSLPSSLIALVLASCQTASGSPAVLVAPDLNVQGELLNIVSGALNGQIVVLTIDSLTGTDRLIVERKAAMPMDGRRLDRPDHFYLIKRGKYCYLRHEQTGTAYRLEKANCRPL